MNSKILQTRIANLLGVAGTDIPVDDIKQLMLPHEVIYKQRSFYVQPHIYGNVRQLGQ
jgi:hypothetical protein